MDSTADQIAAAALELKAFKLNTAEPFTWTTGYRMPIYNDNRLLLSSFSVRSLVAQGFLEIMKRDDIAVDVVAGTATAGIAPATTLADLTQLPLVYVREKPKAHGMKNRVEGQLNKTQRVLLVEDLVSTGKSSLSAVEALREVGAECRFCVALFSYGFESANREFERSYCKLYPLLTFETLLETAQKKQYISASDTETLIAWREDPFGWGEKNGFPRVEK